MCVCVYGYVRMQGINVRQRARELAALLSSNQKIQEEREKVRVCVSVCVYGSIKRFVLRTMSPH